MTKENDWDCENINIEGLDSTIDEMLSKEEKTLV